MFVNTRADLGACSRVHDDEARELFEKAPYSYRKQQYEDEFIRFCQSMLNEVERKIIKGKQRLALIGRTEAVRIILLNCYHYDSRDFNKFVCLLSLL